MKLLSIPEPAARMRSPTLAARGDDGLELPARDDPVGGHNPRHITDKGNQRTIAQALVDVGRPFAEILDQTGHGGVETERGEVGGSAHQMKMAAPPPEPFSPRSSSTGKRICDSIPVMDRMKVNTMPPIRITESRSTNRVLHQTQAMRINEKNRL